jgi:hypothetical protein
MLISAESKRRAQRAMIFTTAPVLHVNVRLDLCLGQQYLINYCGCWHVGTDTASGA